MWALHDKFTYRISKPGFDNDPSLAHSRYQPVSRITDMIGAQNVSTMHKVGFRYNTTQHITRRLNTTHVWPKRQHIYGAQILNPHLQKRPQTTRPSSIITWFMTHLTLKRVNGLGKVFLGSQNHNNWIYVTSLTHLATDLNLLGTVNLLMGRLQMIHRNVDFTITKLSVGSDDSSAATKLRE